MKAKKTLLSTTIALALAVPLSAQALWVTPSTGGGVRDAGSVNFNPDGSGAGGAKETNQWDWSFSTMLAQGVVTEAPLDGGDNEVDGTLWLQGLGGVFKLGVDNVFSSVSQFTMVMELPVTATRTPAAGGVDAEDTKVEFESDGTGTLTIYDMDQAVDTGVGEGFMPEAGFTGTKILEAAMTLEEDSNEIEITDDSVSNLGPGASADTLGLFGKMLLLGDVTGYEDGYFPNTIFEDIRIDLNFEDTSKAPLDNTVPDKVVGNTPSLDNGGDTDDATALNRLACDEPGGGTNGSSDATCDVVVGSQSVSMRWFAEAIPEPGTLALAGIGLLGIGMGAGRRKAKGA